ncbi:hypothetical protein AXE65_04235 [Ventosimonas gracilis]|uniref:Uncharacterized protein n=1 Tax=Ventosimonas gracilis TaxID=1680762 RepID=A0A139SQP6_9GAMM|nr:DUF3375 family protein [Ventosimonas gracilis]KXU36935.1 hypothetical protein AXE65_04235 [Ventosimonas gracilis]
MPFDYATLSILRDRHPAWRLLASKHAPLVASFLHLDRIHPHLRLEQEHIGYRWLCEALVALDSG